MQTPFYRKASYCVIFLFILALITSLFPSYGYNVLASSLQIDVDERTNGRFAQLKEQCLNSKKVRTAQDYGSEKLRYAGAAPDAPILQPKAVSHNDSPEKAARAYLSQCGELFGVADQALELKVEKTKKLNDGRAVVWFQQEYQGIPIFGGELLVHLNNQNKVLSLVSKTMTGVVNTITPVIDAESARLTAIQFVAERYQATEADLVGSEPALWIYDSSIIEPTDGRAPMLVWLLDVQAVGGARAVNVMVLVDARREDVVLEFNNQAHEFEGMAGADAAPIATGGRHDAAPKVDSASAMPQSGLPPLVSIYRPKTPDTWVNSDIENAYVLLCEDVACAEMSDLALQSAYQFAWDTYDYFFSNFGRKSYNNHPQDELGRIYLVTDYGHTTSAGWVQIAREEAPYGHIVFNGNNWMVADVVGHEFTHGIQVTDITIPGVPNDDNTQGGMYGYGQSGAIKESLADLFGELIDQAYTYQGWELDGDNHNWKIGEDLKNLDPSIFPYLPDAFGNIDPESTLPRFGPMRSMSDPPSVPNGRNNWIPPDRMGSSNYFMLNKSEGDSSGIHINNGVNNKAAYLMTEGGLFNNYTINGIGPYKVAKIYYEAMVNHLVRSSDYFDLYNALLAACDILITPEGGSVTTAADCQQVNNAVVAVEMNMRRPDIVNINAISPPMNPTISTSADFTFRAHQKFDIYGNPVGDLLEFECELDAQGFTPCGDSGAETQDGIPTGYVRANMSYSNLSVGQHTFKVRLAGSPALVSSYTWDIYPYDISGNTGVSDVVLTYQEDGVTKTITSDSSGNYSIPVPLNWSGTVTPSKAGHVFSPSSRIYTVVQASLANQDYWTTFPASWSGAVRIVTSRPVIAVGRLHLGPEVMTYNGFGSGGTEMYIPMLFKKAYSGNYNAALNIQNTDASDSAALNIKYYDADAGSLTCEDNFTIARLGVQSLWLPDVTCLPNGWVGGAVITADRPVVAVGRPHIGSQVTTYAGFSSGSRSMYLPMLFKNAFDGTYNAAFYVQNTAAYQAADITIRYYDSNGNLTCTMPPDTLAPLASKGYWLPSVGCLPPGWVGGAVVTATQDVVAIGRPHVGQQVTTYNAFSDGAASQRVPMLFKNAFGGTYNAALYIQNTSASQAAIQISYYDSNGNLTCTVPDTLAALASKGYWLPSVGCLPAGWVGGAVVSANTNIVVLGRPHVGAEVMTYSGVSGGSSSFYLPMLYRNFSGSGGTYNSAIYLQNTDTVNAASVEFLFLDESGSVHCAKTVSLPARATVGYWLPSLTCTP